MFYSNQNSMGRFHSQNKHDSKNNKSEEDFTHNNPNTPITTHIVSHSNIHLPKVKQHAIWKNKQESYSQFSLGIHNIVTNTITKNSTTKYME